MAEHKMAPGPLRDDQPVAEPPGFDQPPTDRIPAAGDLADGQTTAAVSDGQPDRRDEPAGVAPVTETAETVSEPDARTAARPGFFDESAAGRFRDRWRELQADFVDDPARAVRGADELVDEVMRELAERKQGLRAAWRDGPGDTEELRVAMREYRSFFDQLLNA